MGKPNNIAACRASFPVLDWTETPISLVGTSGKIRLELTHLQPRSWGWRLEFTFDGDVYSYPQWSVSARFAYGTVFGALTSARAAVHPLLSALSSTVASKAQTTARE